MVAGSVIKLCNALARRTKPYFIFITGASGAGKTTVASILERMIDPACAMVYFFDSIGNPRPEEMIAHYGAGQAWQERMFQRWITTMQTQDDQKIVILEGSFYPSAVFKILESAQKEHAFIICLDVPRAEREARLIYSRKQVELATDDMEHFVHALEHQTLNYKGTVIYAASQPPECVAVAVISVITNALGLS